MAISPLLAAPSLGAGQLASVDGPLPNDTITFEYDELGRRVERAINGVTSSVVLDAASRVTRETNGLGGSDYVYDGSTRRLSSSSYPNGLTATFSYLNNQHDRRLERINYTQGTTPISEFSYDYDVPANRIVTWSQKSGTQAPIIYTFGYDAANQLTSAIGSHNETTVKTLAYTYDLAGNRLAAQIDGATRQFSYNALNELTTADHALGAPARLTNGTRSTA